VILSDLNHKVKKHVAHKRAGRGRGSGLGKTSGRGQKGAASRSGYRLRLSFEGGQVSLIRHMPKRGFSNYPFRKPCDVVNLELLESQFSDGDTVKIESLAEKGLLDSQHGRVKVLGVGSLTKKLNVIAWAVSKSAREKIEGRGGKVELLGPPPRKPRPVAPVADKKKGPDGKAVDAKAADAKAADAKAADAKAAAPSEKPEKAPKDGAPKGKEKKSRESSE
jgi:large subunit ribosomal protein L15